MTFRSGSQTGLHFTLERTRGDIFIQRESEGNVGLLAGFQTTEPVKYHRGSLFEVSNALKGLYRILEL